MNDSEWKPERGRAMAWVTGLRIWGLAADFLVVAAHDGCRGDDEWSLDQLLNIKGSVDQKESP